MKISVVTIALNDEMRIARTLESVRRQTRPLDEYIVVDGLSTDKTNDIIRSYSDIVTDHISEPDKGIYDAMNKGILRATGDIIGILNAGDYYYPRTIERVQQASAGCDADIYHGDQMTFTEYSDFSFYRYQKPETEIESLESGPTIYHPTCFVSKRLYKSIDMYDTSYRVNADYEFLLRAKRAGAVFMYIPYTLTGFQTGGVSGGCSRYYEAYRIIMSYDLPLWGIATCKLIRCIVYDRIGKLVRWDRLLERRRKR